ncbi:MAG TPA: hypothetical protein VGM39_19955 [Kofleriaceae bacterium]
MSLAATFLAALPKSNLDSVDDPRELDDVLTRSIATAEARWPRVRLAHRDFVAYLAARMTPGESALQQLSSRALDDLYLAFGCTIGDENAVGEFDRSILRDIPRALRRGDMDSAHLEDTRQHVATKLLATTPPGIASYAGRGSLRGWVRVIAIRESGRLKDGTKQETPVADDALFDAVAQGIVPSQSLLKDAYRTSFKTSFEAALAALSIHDRLLLKQHFLDGLSIDRMAALHDVHRATAARWIAKLLETLLGDTRARLQSALHVNAAELDSVLRLIQSCMDASVGRALSPRR